MTWGKKNKYNAVKVFRYGRNWPSKLELSVYEMLLMMERGGKLRDLKCQVTVRFHTYDFGKTTMIPDFRAFDIPLNEEIYIEAKGMPTPTWNRKKKAWAIGGPGKLFVYGGNWQRPKLMQVIVPKTKKEEMEK